MRLRRAWTDLARDEDGSSALEFIVGGVILLVPLVYLIVALGTIQGQALGVETTARHLARTVATSESAGSADARSERVLDALVAEYGLDPAAVSVSVSCVGDGPECPAAGETLRVTVGARVALPLVPPVLGLNESARVEVESTSVQKVSRYWGEP